MVSDDTGGDSVVNYELPVGYIGKRSKNALFFILIHDQTLCLSLNVYVIK